MPSQTVLFFTPSFTITTCNGLRLPRFSFRCQKIARNQVAEKAGGEKREEGWKREVWTRRRRSTELRAHIRCRETWCTRLWVNMQIKQLAIEAAALVQEGANRSEYFTFSSKIWEMDESASQSDTWKLETRKFLPNRQAVFKKMRCIQATASEFTGIRSLDESILSTHTHTNCFIAKRSLLPGFQMLWLGWLFSLFIDWPMFSDPETYMPLQSFPEHNNLPMKHPWNIYTEKGVGCHRRINFKVGGFGLLY